MLRRLLRDYLSPYRGWLSAVVVLQFTATVAMLYLPSLNADIIDNGVAQGDTGYIVKVGGIMLAIAMVQAACSMSSAWFGSQAAMACGRDLRAAVFGRIGTFSSREVSTYGAPSLITRATNDVQQVQMLAMMTCLMAVTIPIMMVGGIVMAMREDFGLSWLVVASCPCCSSASGSSSRRWCRRFAPCRNGSMTSTACSVSRSPVSG